MENLRVRTGEAKKKGPNGLTRGVVERKDRQFTFVGQGAVEKTLQRTKPKKGKGSNKTLVFQVQGEVALGWKKDFRFTGRGGGWEPPDTGRATWNKGGGGGLGGKFLVSKKTGISWNPPRDLKNHRATKRKKKKQKKNDAQP